MRARHRRFIDDPEYIEPGDPPCILGRLPLCVREIRRTGDDRLLDLLPQVSLSVCLQLLENEG